MAEEKAERQGAPEPEEGVDETCPPAPDSVPPSTQPLADVQPPVEQPSWRDLDAPVLPALMNRKRTVEKRDQEKTIRFTRTAVGVIGAAAHQRGQKFAGFVGDAALAVALGKAGLVGSPEDDPVRPLIEAVEAHTVALNRIGGNLNRITAAIHRGTVPERAETVLDRVEQAAKSSYQLIDQLLAEGTAHGS
ncbi:MobC family plasmid mobilization relaxosome protein [Streptomyces albidoflavus]|uniref:MobC family plasmid mobilization relaxosome protein n=1 Tax=Streptomyces albidoflavus TaxID=1886 RepID=UPI0021D5CB07|nr:MobC family plasmid mobilization relaxosome protein [Streptomyces albidoflavus]MCU7703235.1 MobC family plasmid mobilization relaxosome protein [Streptomyces albidoflavus]